MINFKGKELIKVKTISNYENISSSLSKKISEVKNEECKNSLNNMLKRIDETYYEENITIEKYYKAYFKDDKTIINYFDDVLNSCKLSREDTDVIYIDALASTNYPNKIKEKYIFRYELTFSDKGERKKIKYYDEVGTYTTKSLELKVLKELIEEVNS